MKQDHACRRPDSRGSFILSFGMCRRRCNSCHIGVSLRSRRVLFNNHIVTIYAARHWLTVNGFTSIAFCSTHYPSQADNFKCVIYGSIFQIEKRSTWTRRLFWISRCYF